MPARMRGISAARLAESGSGVGGRDRAAGNRNQESDPGGLGALCGGISGGRHPVEELRQTGGRGGFARIPNTQVLIKFNAKPRTDVTLDSENAGDDNRFVTAKIPVTGQPDKGQAPLDRLRDARETKDGSDGDVVRFTAGLIFTISD